MSELVDKIVKQQNLTKKIKELQNEEKALRQEVLDALFGTGNNVGSLKAQEGDFIVTGSYGLTYKFDQENLSEAIEEGFLSNESLEVIRTELKLDKKAYDQMDDTSEIDDYLIVKPSLPTIKVAYAKVDENE